MSAGRGEGRSQEEVDLEFERMTGARRRGPNSQHVASQHAAAGDSASEGVGREVEEPEDFTPPDPALPAISSRSLWAWSALVAGLGLGLLAALAPSLPRWSGMLGIAVAALAVVALLSGIPRARASDPDSDDDDGAVL